MVQYIVAFDASTSRPCTSSAPVASRSRSAASSAALVGCRAIPSICGGIFCAGALCGAALLGSPPDGGRADRPPPLARCSRHALLLAAASAMPDPVAVLARAHVAGRLKRQSAQRAWRASLADNPDGAAGECTGCLRRDAHAKDGRAVFGNVVGQW